ncbi:MAG: outer membrane beta-barrel protein [Pseudomonadota bacterium]
MTKRLVLLLAMAALLGFAVPSQGNAQATLYISGGAAIPIGDFGEFSKTGWMAAGGVLFDAGPSGLGIGAEVFYGQNNHEADVFNSKTTPYGAMAIVDYAFGTAGGIRPYVFGGLGLLVHRISGDGFDSESDSQFGYQFGGGVSFPIGGTTSLYGEGRYMGSESTKYFGVLAGLAFGLGN